MSHPSFQAPTPEELAELLPQYEIEFFIAQGGMGAVYKGVQISLDRDIAIKVLPVELGENEEFRESFITEAKAMAKLNHPNLLGVFDYGDVEGMPYIVMEYVDGESLHDAAWDQAIEPKQAVAIVKDICDGLSHAHKHGIIHRDIKPSNILLTTSIEAKIADFGLAKAADSETEGLDMGTPGYTAPEVFEDSSQAGPLADQYAVGVILHQLLTGMDPAGSMEPPTESTGNLILDRIWRKATSIDPSQRYPSIAAMGAELEKWSKAKTPAPVRSNPVPTQGYRAPVPVSSTSGGNGAVIKILFVTVLALVGVFIYLQSGAGDEKPDKKTAQTNKPEKPKFDPAAGLDETPDSDDNADADNDDDFRLPDFTSLDKPEAVNPFDDPSLLGDNDDDDMEEDTGSDDSDTETVVDSDEELAPGDPELRELAVGLIKDAQKKRNEALIANIRALHFYIDSGFRDIYEEERRLIESLKDNFDTGWIPAIGSTSGVPQKTIDAIEKARGKEETIESEYQTELTRIKAAYVTRLETAANEATEEDLKKRLLAQAERAGDLTSWVNMLVPDENSREQVVKEFVGGNPAVVGNWDNHSYNKVSRWIAHPDGRMEIVGEEWEVTWEVLEDGTLLVKWPRKDPYRYQLKGDEWVGTTPFGKEARLVRGDW